MPGSSSSSRADPWPGLKTSDISSSKESSYYLLAPPENGKPFPRDPMLIYRSVQNGIGKIVGAIPSSKGQRYVLEINDDEQKQKTKNFVKLEDGTPCVVQLHKGRNSSRCVITSMEAKEYSEEELLNILSDQRVTKVERNSTRKEGQTKLTNSFVLTINNTNIPEYIYIGFERCSTRNFYPNPLLCQNCFDFGHTQKHCSERPGRKTKCGICSEDHPTRNEEGALCTKESYCFRCKSKDHQLRSRLCPHWKAEKEIQTLKVDQRLDYKVARERYLRNQVTPNKSYASQARNLEHVSPPTNQVNTEITKTLESFKEVITRVNAFMERMETSLQESNATVRAQEKLLNDQSIQIRMLNQRNERLSEQNIQQQKQIHELINIKGDKQDDPTALKRQIVMAKTEIERLNKKVKEYGARDRSRSSSKNRNENGKNTSTSQSKPSPSQFLTPSQPGSQRSSSPGNSNKRSQTSLNDDPEPPTKIKPNQKVHQTPEEIKNKNENHDEDMVESSQ